MNSAAGGRDPQRPDRLVRLHAELGIPPDYAENRQLRFVPEAAASELIEVARDAEKTILLVRPAAEAWRQMAAAATQEQVTLLAVSGFRSVERQTEIIRGKLARGVPIAEVLRVMAAPGYSEHHSGRAIDIGVPDEPPLEEDFEYTSAYGWLTLNAGRFGFSLSFPRGNPLGFIYEPWHWQWEPFAGR